MANNLSSNVTRQLARVFLEEADHSRVLTKTVDTQLLSGRFGPSSGSTVDFKRPHDYNTIETAGGDISGSTKSDILSGKATGTVQNYITVAVDYDEVEEALELDQLDQILRPAAKRMITQLELNLGQFMINNGGFSYGDPDEAVDAWSDIAGAVAKAHSMGIPSDELYYVMNPYVQSNLADAQSALASGKTGLVDTAWERAQISKNFAGAMVMVSNALKTRLSSTTADRAGAVASVGASTYVAHKDTMIQTINVDGFTGTPVIKAGEIVEVTGKYQLSLATREPFLDGAGAKVKWRGVVTEDSAAFSSGAGAITVAGPAIFEADGQYNTVDAALADGDVITILGTDTTTYQPAMLYHKQAFGLGTVKLKKLNSIDTVATTRDGFSIRVSKGSDFDKNQQKIRFDMLPAFACFNPFFGGQCFGVGS
jgi:hypothetical protein